jgi:hypothetical protein
MASLGTGAAPAGILGSTGNAALTSGLSAYSTPGWGGGAASAAPAASVAPAGQGFMSGIQNMLSQKSGGGEGGGGGGGSGPLSEIGALLSKSKKSGLGAATPQPLDISQGMKGYVDMSDPGQPDRMPMDIEGFMSQIMGR